ncbi:ADP-ribosylation factor-like protein 6-interacting protein 4 isoform X2 [Paramormyrops kingsleyae]|uniref:ADP-ribosylation factor-like protein 6-interacting protein 4 isoform X2 n=1 Tax=Paramormyrops kingsleyae TaxID=1676925 RepID=UPI000CD5F108|nr:ADP-ribosylation factor-like protein 6-interacting protein 4 isoform X2 [Paramormyrops kingsleyae]
MNLEPITGWSCSEEKKRDKKQARRRSSSTSSSDSSSSSSSSDSSDEETRKKKRKRKLKKMKAREKKKERKERKKQKKKMKKLRKLSGKDTPSLPPDPQTPTNKLSCSLEMWQTEGPVEHGPVMTDEQKARLSTKRPLTKEEWEAQQSVIRRVVDPETGRTRLVRGEGEILEEIVSRDKHKEINKQATKGDGSAFQRRLGINR